MEELLCVHTQRHSHVHTQENIVLCKDLVFGQGRMSFDYKAEGQGRCGLIIHLTV